ncbi:hypothetical protein ACLK1S_24120 [Escherichia coli]
MGERKGDLKNMNPDGRPRTSRLRDPKPWSIGFRSKFMTMTSGTGLAVLTFSHYDDVRPGEVGQRQNGVLISNGQGKAVAFALFGLQDCGSCSSVTVQKFTKVRLSGIHSPL